MGFPRYPFCAKARRVSVRPPPALPYRHLVHRLRDPDEFGSALSGARLVADFFDRQALPTRVEQFQTPGWTLDFHEAHVKARICGPLAPGWGSLGLMRAPVEASWHGQAAGQGVLVWTPPGESLDGFIAPGFTSLAVNVPVAVWEQCRVLAGVERPAFGGVIALTLPPPLYFRIERQLRSIRHLLRTAGASPKLGLAAARAAADFATQMVTLAWELAALAPLEGDSLRNRRRIVRRAEDWMRAHLGEPFRIPDVCLALRVSRRELEYAFRTVFDQSPRDFLQTLRLNAIHRTLCRADAAGLSLFDLAFAHGMTHPSRFAAHYRALFGESPSETQKARRSGEMAIVNGGQP